MMLRTLPALLGGALALITAGCSGAQTYEPRSTALAPDSDATIVADISKEHGQARLTVTIEHLAPPERIASGGRHYFVWSRQSDSVPWRPVGALVYDEGDRRGELAETTVPALSFDLQVTVENTTTPATPSKSVIVSQRVDAN
jgi:hypothetical protein